MLKGMWLCSKGNEVAKTPCDFRALLESFDDDTEFVANLVESGLTSFNEYRTSLVSALGSRDFDKIRTVAHALKGSSANLVCCPLSSASSDLEIYVKKSTKIFVKQKVKLVLDEIDRVSVAMEGFKNDKY